jgi:hypothetical protein
LYSGSFKRGHDATILDWLDAPPWRQKERAAL